MRLSVPHKKYILEATGSAHSPVTVNISSQASGKPLASFMFTGDSYTMSFSHLTNKEENELLPFLLGKLPELRECFISSGR